MELPDDGRAQDELWFSNILVGVLRGALEMVRSGQAILDKYSRGGRCTDSFVRYICKSKHTSSAMSSEATIPPRCE